MNRIRQHPILGEDEERRSFFITLDGERLEALEGETVAATLLAHNVRDFRYTAHHEKPRSIYCGIGRCTDCIMIIDGVPNQRTCITTVREGMAIERQHGYGTWQKEASDEI